MVGWYHHLSIIIILRAYTLKVKLLTRTAISQTRGAWKESLFFKRDKVALGLRGFPFTDALLFFVNSLHYILHIIILRALSIQVFGLFLSIGYFLFLKN